MKHRDNEQQYYVMEACGEGRYSSIHVFLARDEYILSHSLAVDIVSGTNINL